MDFEVLCPWAEVDAIPLKGNNPRIANLNGKTVGLFAYFKEWGPVIMREVERQLKTRFPAAKFSHFSYPKHVKEVMEDPEYKDAFQNWVKGIDIAVSGFGD